LFEMIGRRDSQHGGGELRAKIRTIPIALDLPISGGKRGKK